MEASGRTLDRFENEGAEFFDRVRQAYLARAVAEPERIRLIDATKTIEDIQKTLEEAILLD
jgi:dTMP kinase